MKSSQLLFVFLTWVIFHSSNLSAQNSIDVFSGDNIQAAIDTAAAGDTIKVGSGLFMESLVIDKKIHLVAAGPDTDVVIQSSTNTVTYNSGSEGSTISGFTISSTTGTGIVVNNLEVTIAHNIVRDCAADGIIADGCFIVGNTITNNNNGINANDNEKTVIVGNTITDNTNHGIYNLRGIASANTITGNGDGDDAGIYVEENGIVSGNTIDSTNGYGIRISADVTKIYSNDVKNSTLDGIYSDQFSNSSWHIKNNLIRSNGAGGINWTDADTRDRSTHTIISNNVIYNNTDYGIFVGNNSIAFLLDFLIIHSNIVAGNTYGIGFFGLIAGRVDVTDFYLLYNNFYNNTNGNYNSGLEAGPGDISTDPLFQNTTIGDFTLQAGSPGINSGHPNLLESDLDLSRNDMGIYGGSFTWDNYFNNSAAVRVLKLDLSDRSVLQGESITITGTGVAN